MLELGHASELMKNIIGETPTKDYTGAQAKLPFSFVNDFSMFYQATL